MRHVVLAAVLCGLFLATGAWAADKDEQAIRETILKAYQNWAALNPDANNAYYAPDAKAVWFDLAPLQYVSWENYREGCKKGNEGLESANLKVHDDLAVNHRGNVAWVTYTWTAELHFKGGKVERSEARGTDVLEKRQGKWTIVHEHVSFPAPM
jgi:ketosteroid isomerase-like protein